MRGERKLRDELTVLFYRHGYGTLLWYVLRKESHEELRKVYLAKVLCEIKLGSIILIGDEFEESPGFRDT